MIDQTSLNPDSQKGALVLVVGPSGSGKDTLIGMAHAQLSHDRRFIFPRRVITRIAHIDAEDHDTLTPEDFETARRAGHFLCIGGPWSLLWIDQRKPFAC